mmetsp:Transcript_40163/g.93323  ORF Transcript_40163/g.93323 Transcript_40163/m.93323 type:complete len:703 (-) Transcript_40163:70-2178(-)
MKKGALLIGGCALVGVAALLARRARRKRERKEAPLDVVIIGAGISGLQSLRECLRLGLRVRVLEKAVLPGGKWSGHGIYECVQIQQHKEDFFVPGLPWPEGAPDFAKRDDMVSKTDEYIARYGLMQHIECRSEVVSCVFDESSQLWQVATSAGTSFSSRFVAWAVGTLGPPVIPTQVSEALKGFKGDVVHSHAYFRPLSYSGQHVVILGFGASSVEIAQDLARNGGCASVSLVAPPKVQAGGRRHGQDWVLSRALPGTSTRVCSTGAEATLDERNAAVREAMAKRHPTYPQCMPEDMQPSGTLDGPKPAFPGMDGRPLGGRVIVSEGFLDCMAEGSIRCCPGYICSSDAEHITVGGVGEPTNGKPTNGDGAHVASGGGVTLPCDALVVCTGYEAPTRRIAKTMSPAPASCETLYKGMWFPDVPNAAFVGHVYGFVAVPPCAALQAQFLARVVSGGEALPGKEQMLSWVADVKERFDVTQRLTDNAYFRELRRATLGETVAAKVPVGPGPPPEMTDVVYPNEKELARNEGTEDADDVVARHCAGEALHFLEETHRGNFGELSVLSLGAVGKGSLKMLAAFEARLRPAERPLLRSAVEMAIASYPWEAQSTSSVDTVLCSGQALNGVAPDASFVREVLRVLRPGGHAIMAFCDRTTAASWTPIFDAFEKGGSGTETARWRMVHKTALRALPLGGSYLVFVFRAR